MKVRMVSMALALALVFGLASLPFSPTAQAQPIITYAAAAPNMVSLFGDRLPTGSTPDSPLGPGWTTLAVRTTGTTTSVKLDLRSFLLSILPADMSPYLYPTITESWNGYLISLQAVDMTYNAGANLWTYSFSLDAFFARFPGFLRVGKTLEVIGEGMRLGSKTITATGYLAHFPGPSASITIYVVDGQTPLKIGWNLLSAPIALGNNTWSQVMALGDASTNIDLAYRWAPTTQDWQTVATTYTLQPLEAIYVHSLVEQPLGAVLSRSVNAPPFRTLSAGWNLVGAAPDLGLYPTSYKTAFSAGSYRALSKVTEALATLVSGSTYYYSLAVVPGQERDYSKSYTHLGTTVGSHAWGYVQDPWTYIAAAPGTIPSAPVTSGTYYGWIVPFGGLWVYVESSRTLAGFSTTPVSDSWLRTARNIVLGF